MVTIDTLRRAIVTTSDPGAYRLYNVFSTDKTKAYREKALKHYIYYKFLLVAISIAEIMEKKPHLKNECDNYMQDLVLALDESFSRATEKFLGYGCSSEEMLRANKIYYPLVSISGSKGLAFLHLCGVVEDAGIELQFDSELKNEIETALNEASQFLDDVLINKRSPNSADGCLAAIIRLCMWLLTSLWNSFLVMSCILLIGCILGYVISFFK